MQSLQNSETNHGIQFLDIDEIKDIENNLALDIFNFAIQSKYDGWVETITFGVNINSRSGYWSLRPHVNISVNIHYQSMVDIELSLTGYKG